MNENTLEEMADNISINKVAALLVKLYAEYMRYSGCDNDEYAIAVGIAVRMLSDL